MYDRVISSILAREKMAFEENERFNSQREILLRLAPDCWNELKATFREECAKLSAHSLVFKFECDEPDDDTLFVNRIVGHGVINDLTFSFDRVVPRIMYHIARSKQPTKVLEFVLCGPRVFLSGTVVPRLVQELMVLITLISGDAFP